MPVLVVGIVAGCISVAVFVPQAWRIVKTRRTEDLSITMWVLQVAAFVAWTVYGAFLRAWPIVIVNAVCCLLSAFILVMCALPSRLRHRVADKIATGEGRSS